MVRVFRLDAQAPATSRLHGFYDECAFLVNIQDGKRSPIPIIPAWVEERSSPCR